MGFIKEKFSLRFFLIVGIVFLLLQVPFLGDYLRVINTVIHESGHAIQKIIGYTFNYVRECRKINITHIP